MSLLCLSAVALSPTGIGRAERNPKLALSVANNLPLNPTSLNRGESVEPFERKRKAHTAIR